MVKAIANGTEAVTGYFMCSRSGPAVFVALVVGFFGFALPAIVSLFN